jgi:hypothetical protein
VSGSGTASGSGSGLRSGSLATHSGFPATRHHPGPRPTDVRSCACPQGVVYYFCGAIEDALKRLDSLTQGEVQMAASQVLKATNTVDETGRVRGVANLALTIDNRVADVGVQVLDVDDKVTVVMDGA